MEVKSLFSTPLIMTELADGSPLIPSLRASILARREQSDGVSHSNEGGWQSDDDLIVWAGSAGDTLVSGIKAILEQCTGTFDGKLVQKQALEWKIQAWANINQKGNGNALHFHPASYWSGTLYVDDGGIDGREHLGGAIEFKDPRGAAPLMYAPGVKMALDGCLTAGLAERIYPKTGQLIIFPSWLAHCVTPYRGNGTRISIAFNCSLW
jgi:uncharacterized protein (TIGR02466 family)